MSEEVKKSTALTINRIDADEYIDALDIDENIKNSVRDNSKLRERVAKWLNDQIGGNQFNCVKVCNVEYIDYNNMKLEEMDEYDMKENARTIRENQNACGHHIVCPVYNNGATVKGSRCMLEAMDVDRFTKATYQELEIGPEDFTDRLMVDQMVTMLLVNNRSLRDLAAGDLISEIKTYSKGGLKIETKTNELLNIAERTQKMIDSMRKQLLATREDKARFKQLKKNNEGKNVQEKISDIIKERENSYSFDPAAFVDAEVVEDPKEEISKINI